MKIALDFDETYTRDPEFWVEFIDRAQARGHEVKIVTYRKRRMTDPALDWLEREKCPVIYTEFNQKREFCAKQCNWFPDIWIDDSPEYIV